MKNSVFIIILFLVFHANAQKSVDEIINNSKVKTIVINDDKLFKINVTTTNDNVIKLQSRIEGEYSKDIIVSAKAQNDTLYFSSSFQPFYKDHNDKLSAHKVLSLEVSLWLPKQLNVYVKSAIASAEIKGNYKHLTVELPQGNTNVLNFKGDAVINSISGNITIETNNAIVEVFSKNGSLNIQEIDAGNSKIKLNTMNGNISVIKAKK